jgi:hypothetical protein
MEIDCVGGGISSLFGEHSFKGWTGCEKWVDPGIFAGPAFAGAKAQRQFGGFYRHD